jgi:MFS family permease
MLVVGAIFEGLARSFFSGNNEALLHDTLAESGEQNTYQEHLGKTASMYQIALAISAVIGSILASISFPLVLWLSVIPQILSLIVSLGFVEPKIHEQRETNVYAHLRIAFLNIVRNPRLRNLSLGSILGFSLGEAAFEFRAAFIASLWPVWAIGITRLISNLLAAVSFYFAGRVIQRFGELRIMMTGLLVSHTLTFILTVVPTVLSPALMSTMSIFFGVVTVSSSGLRQREFTAQQRATMGSLTSFGSSLGFAVFALLLGALADQIGAAGAFAVATLIGFIPAFFYWRAFYHPSADSQPVLNPD